MPVCREAEYRTRTDDPFLTIGTHSTASRWTVEDKEPANGVFLVRFFHRSGSPFGRRIRSIDRPRPFSRVLVPSRLLSVSKRRDSNTSLAVRSIALFGGDYDGQMMDVDIDLDIRSGMVPLISPLQVDDTAYFGTDWVVRGVRLFVHEQLRDREVAE